MKLLAIATTVALLSSSAYAADIGTVDVAPFSWTGLYMGANAGIGWTAGNQLSDTAYHHPEYGLGTFGNGWFDSQSESRDASFTGGAQIGYNQQYGSFVFGVEADLNYLNTKSNYAATTDQTIYADPNYVYNLTEDLETEAKIEWFGTIRPRIGVTAAERLLVYGTGGLAYGQVKSSASYGWHEYGFWWGGPDGDHDFDRSGSFNGSSSGVRWGWTIGAGLEYALTEKVSLKGEYLYVDLGDKNHSVANPEDAAERITWSDSAQFHAVRMGLNYRF